MDAIGDGRASPVQSREKEDVAVGRGVQLFTFIHADFMSVSVRLPCVHLSLLTAAVTPTARESKPKLQALSERHVHDMLLFNKHTTGLRCTGTGIYG